MNGVLARAKIPLVRKYNSIQLLRVYCASRSADEPGQPESFSLLLGTIGSHPGPKRGLTGVLGQPGLLVRSPERALHNPGWGGTLGMDRLEEHKSPERAAQLVQPSQPSSLRPSLLFLSVDGGDFVSSSSEALLLQQ